jgi:hypothetical protein
MRYHPYLWFQHYFYPGFMGKSDAFPDANRAFAPPLVSVFVVANKWHIRLREGVGNQSDPVGADTVDGWHGIVGKWLRRGYKG